jgi:hypothetical protein
VSASSEPPSPSSVVAWTTMGVPLVITFAEWRRGLASLGMPDWLSWIVGITGAPIIAIVWLGLAGAMTGVLKEVETVWGGLLWIAFCLPLWWASARSIWVCERGGGIDVTFP